MMEDVSHCNAAEPVLFIILAHPVRLCSLGWATGTCVTSLSCQLL